MTQKSEQELEQLVDAMAQKSSPEHLEKLDAQFASKLARVEERGQASEEMLAHLRLFWRMLKAPDEVVPWKSKALIMAALMYFASPLDLIPDLVGKAGYLDDAMVLRIVHNRLEKQIEAFRRRGD